MDEPLYRIWPLALEQTAEGIIICDALQPDMPMVYVNHGFEHITGYGREEVMGKNCRMLQGKETDPQAIVLLRSAIAQKQSATVELINYHKSGKPFWNRLTVAPVFEQDRLTHYIGIQCDVTAQRETVTLEEKVAYQKLITQISLQAQEKERDEIGKELHDNINQLLATCKLYLNIAYTDKALRMDMIRQSEALINTTIEEIRKLSKALVGPRFDEISLHQSIDDLVKTLRVAVPFRIQYACRQLDEERLSQSKKLVLFRIVQEQLNNIIKHAQAKQVSIELQQCHNGVSLTIKDDGIGFNVGATYAGIGLKNINSRVALENGTVQIHSREGNGCEMKVVLPL